MKMIFYGWTKLYCVYTPYFLPFICWWTSRLVAWLGHCDLCCNKHGCPNMSCVDLGPFGHTRSHYIWVIQFCFWEISTAAWLAYILTGSVERIFILHPSSFVDFLLYGIGFLDCARPFWLGNTESQYSFWKDASLLLCVWKFLPICMCVHYVDTVSMKAGRRHHVPWTCEPPCGYRESNLDLLKEQPLLLTTKPFLQPP